MKGALLGFHTLHRCPFGLSGHVICHCFYGPHGPDGEGTTKRRTPLNSGAIAAMPYIDINNHRQRPKWLSYLVLAVLGTLTVVVIVLALTANR
jgi:hypothetical protein